MDTSSFSSLFYTTVPLTLAVVPIYLLKLRYNISAVELRVELEERTRRDCVDE
ncbi:hypothetical protein CC80DRAFT_493845 [Byssothecium circinans]|uniref:Uncharacterized protein n=1 Tax=Byssothecium circinans TaxID=147558 RepID=A0A6A5TNS1_9PLEO|nr:hypothetical protein CC80DRAFT_493845 [Byssothecium circinans]